MTEVWIVRHGETPWNVERRVQGWEDIPLNAPGVGQAQALGRHLARLRAAGTEFDAIYSSDLKRAHQTATIVSESLGMEPRLEPGVRERNYGVLQGLDFTSMHEHQPEAAAIWRSREPEATLPGGESLGAFHRRVVGAVDALASRHPGERIVVVSHGGAMDIMWRHANQVDLRAPRAAPLLNASINRLEVGPQGWRIISWGEVTHLDQVTDTVGNDVSP